jgi:hypothetical protein
MRWLIAAAMIVGSGSFSASAAKINLQWERSGDATVVGYQLYSIPAAGGRASMVQVGNTNAAALTSLVEGLTYRLYVTALGMDGTESEPSNMVDFTVPFGNRPPVIGFLADQFVEAGGTVRFEVTAYDMDVKGQTLSFGLGAGAPIGAVVDPVTGIFSWTPTAAQVPSTNRISVVVTDNGSPAQTVTNSFSVIAASPGQYYALQIGGFLNGKVQRTPRGIMSSLGEAYAAGTKVTLMATPRAGYVFTGWMIDGQILTSNPLTITMNRNMLVTPIFRSASLTLASLLTPQISLEIGLAAGRPSLFVGGELGAWVMEGTANLKDWVVVGAGLTSDELAVTPSAGYAFYRVRSRPLGGIL